MIVDDRCDASHEGQSCRHVQMKVERLAEPENEHQRGIDRRKRVKRVKRMTSNYLLQPDVLLVIRERTEM